MKTKRLLALVLALVTILSCISIPAFAENEAYALKSESSLTEGGVTFKKGDDTVTTAKAGDEITVTATAVDGYDVVLSSSDVEITDGKFKMISGTVTVKATYTPYAFLDDTNNTKKDIDQSYTFTQTGEEYTDVTKVKLEWTISDIVATYASNKTWNPDTLTWVEAKEDVSVTEQTSTFKLTNYSSTNVQANVTFTVEDSLKDTYDADNSTFDNNDCIVKTPVVQNTTTTYQNSDFTAKAQTITATLKFSADAFKNLSAQDTAAKYGTYTVTIGEVSPNYLTFTAKTAGSTVTPKFASGTYQYSTDNGTTWVDGSNSGTTIKLANVGDSVVLKGKNCTTTYPLHFAMSGSISASGSVTSLTDGCGVDKDVALSNSCYYAMFDGCSALTTAPELPATTLTEKCYYDMFCGTSITVAPELPAKTLAKDCYYYMFDECSALLVAPELPAMDLADSCYRFMFRHCSALKTAPDLPATELKDNCYSYMFCGCTTLENAPTISATTLADCCYAQMFTNCKALKKVPTLSIVQLKDSCYYSMFEGCSSLKITTVKPSGTEGTDWGIIIGGAKTTATDSVKWMFYDCSGLDSGLESTPTIAEDITYYWYIVQ